MPAPQPVDPCPPKRLQSAVIADTLEAEIIAGTLPSGSKLDEQALANRFGASRTPVREALQLLASRSLAERVPYRGVIVAQITRERIDMLFETMGEIEATCGRLAAERMTMSERAALEELHQSMGDMAARGAHEAYEQANTQFHTLIFEGAHNAELLAVANGLRLKLAPFRKSQLKASERMKRSAEEHDAIVTAILERNAKGAEKALRRHLLSAARAVLASMG
ncbi:GntR family transcriptional regulator [Roseibium aestuarii]|uniref:GntR family transcriptional regulator n=1 Tax=Roseibium aestuarii TaxID=2600299 RepID=A0ABW4K1E6_9HYPH|nr:GntR family transcriptional regulator [Roseibium aestuarii]